MALFTAVPMAPDELSTCSKAAETLSSSRALHRPEVKTNPRAERACGGSGEPVLHLQPGHS